MYDREAALLNLAELDAMIARAEAACERYRVHAEESGVHPQTARMRYQKWRSMEDTLSRLRAQRETEAVTPGPETPARHGEVRSFPPPVQEEPRRSGRRAGPVRHH